VDSILGRPSKFVFCTRYSVLTEELSKVDRETTTLVISCLSGIVTNVMSTPDVKSGLEKVMTSIGSMFLEIVKTCPRMKIVAVHCTPRDLPDYDTHSSFAMVF
jgi:hypothetical protein